MKKLYVLSLAVAMATASFAQHNFKAPTQAMANKYGAVVDAKSHIQFMNETKTRAQEGSDDAFEILSCKEGTVYGNEYTAETVWSGFACADGGRPDFPTEYYQHFDNCFYTFDQIRFLGFFNYWNNEEYNWYFCNERGGMDENGDLQKPITFNIGVYEEGEDGMPGKCILQKEVELVGEKTPVITGYEDEGFSHIYEFTAPFGETINLEHGYIMISAKDMGDSPTCWFSLFTAGDLIAYQKDYVNEEYMGQMSCVFCLHGDGSRNAQKALQLERFVTPTTSATGKYEKVQVEISNIGEQNIDNARLELYVDSVLVTTEDVPVTLQSEDYYKYTFNVRVDCTQEHEIMVKNVTPGDEKKAYETLSTTITPPSAGAYPECGSRVADVIMITNVTVGDINNTTEGSTYSDFTSMNTNIRPGETLKLEVTLKTDDYEPSAGVYVDWNEDHVFNYNEAVEFDSFEADDFSGKGTATITVPATAKLGAHRMRVVGVPYYYDPDPGYVTYYGETEDYTITVLPAAGAPIYGIDKTIIDQQMASDSEQGTFTISNSGESNLQSSIAFNYILPGVPSNISQVAPAQKTSFNGKFNMARRAPGKRMAPAKDNSIEYVLHYDGDNYDCISISNSPTAIFASLYPGAMLSNLAGMTISSVDVFIGDLPESASIVLYGQNKQDVCGELILEQAFTPTDHSWNRVELSKPVEIGNTDIWVGVKMTGVNDKGYFIGVDHGPASVGFGDLVNIGGDYWWSMADLGLNYNYSIRANITGTRTPAISWLSIDKESVEVAPGKEEKVTLSFDSQNLKSGVYEAIVEISSNDVFNSLVKLPVYMVKDNETAISAIENGKPGIVFNGSTVTVKSAKDIQSIKISDLSGRSMFNARVQGNVATADLAKFGKGIYIVTVKHADGTSMSVKASVR